MNSELIHVSNVLKLVTRAYRHLLQQCAQPTLMIDFTCDFQCYTENQTCEQQLVQKGGIVD